MRSVARILAIALGMMSVGATGVRAQVLARPGWAGSGVTVEAWWKRGVIYRVDVATFQDSNGDGVGDLDGLTQRLGYVQQLGVDAVILMQPKTGAHLVADDVGTFVRKAAEQHVRVLVELPSTDVAEARAWLNQGIAGLFVDFRAQSTHGVASSEVVRALRRVVDSFPGGRVLVANGIPPSAEGAQLSVGGSFADVEGGAAVLRDKLQMSLDAGSTTGAPLLEVVGLASAAGKSGPEQAVAERTLAALVLGSRAAVMFDAGRELGLQGAGGKPVVMQWTPGNVTKPPAPVEAEVKKPVAPQPEVYGAYTPYVAPKPVPIGPKVMAPVGPETVAPVAVDPDTLPGFTTGAVASLAQSGGNSAMNVAMEDGEASSLLNFYRHLIALHHDNGSIRNGSETLFDRDGLNALVWVRRAPAGSRTAASVVIACNLSDRPVAISLSEDFAPMRIRGGTLRPLLTASASDSGVVPLQSTEKLSLAAESVFVGELYHSGSEEPVVARRSSRSHHRRH